MTDKQIIKTLRNLKEYCDKKDCLECTFDSETMINNSSCKIKSLASVIAHEIPKYWNMEEIERIIND